MFDYDAELRLHNQHFRAATAIAAGDRVLDVGCGAGQTTREAARTAKSALGVDVSSPLLERARELSKEIHNVTYLLADAAIHPFPEAGFDVCISRFGTMFFPDPVAAFTNIGLALRPGARLVLLVWQAHDRNEWSTSVQQALSGTSTTHAAFSLGDPATTEGVLTAAGFSDVGFAEVHEPVYYGPDAASAYDTVLSLRDPRELIDGLPEQEAGRIRDRLRALLAAHETDAGVLFDSRAWIVEARRT